MAKPIQYCKVKNNNNNKIKKIKEKKRKNGSAESAKAKHVSSQVPRAQSGESGACRRGLATLEAVSDVAPGGLLRQDSLFSGEEGYEGESLDPGSQLCMSNRFTFLSCGFSIGT